MEIDREEQEAPKDVDLSTLDVHLSYDQEESIDPTKLVDMPKYLVVINKRPTWLHDNCRMQRSIQILVVLSKKVKYLMDSLVTLN